jgi:serine O-acetyltransferase
MKILHGLTPGRNGRRLYGITFDGASDLMNASPTRPLPAEVADGPEPLSVRVFAAIRSAVQAAAEEEPCLAAFFKDAVLQHTTLGEALACVLSARLGGALVHRDTLQKFFVEAHGENPDLAEAAAADLLAVRERDPACASIAYPLLFFKGYQALQSYRVAHHLWHGGQHWLALYLQSRTSQLLSVDIHPAARIGRGILIDHGHSIVIGETAVVEDDVSILHEVTLGGTGKACGDRHPKVRRGSMLAAGVKIFGNIEIGEGAKIGGGSVVLRPVSPHTTVAGVPARLVGKPRVASPSLLMDQDFTGDYAFIGEGI